MGSHELVVLHTLCFLLWSLVKMSKIPESEATSSSPSPSSSSQSSPQSSRLTTQTSLSSEYSLPPLPSAPPLPDRDVVLSVKKLFPDNIHQHHDLPYSIHPGEAYSPSHYHQQLLVSSLFHQQDEPKSEIPNIVCTSEYYTPKRDSGDGIESKEKGSEDDDTPQTETKLPDQIIMASAEHRKIRERGVPKIQKFFENNLALKIIIIFLFLLFIVLSVLISLYHPFKLYGETIYGVLLFLLIFDALILVGVLIMKGAAHFSELSQLKKVLPYMGYNKNAPVASRSRLRERGLLPQITERPNVVLNCSKPLGKYSGDG